MQFIAIFSVIWLNEKVFHFHFDRMPFNWKTPIGFLVIFLFQCVNVNNAAMIVTPTMCFFVGSCILLKSLIEDITNDLNSLNQDEQKMSKLDKRKKIAKEDFCYVIQEFSDVKQLSVLFLHFSNYLCLREVENITKFYQILDLSWKSIRYMKFWSLLSSCGFCYHCAVHCCSLILN